MQFDVPIYKDKNVVRAGELDNHIILNLEDTTVQQCVENMTCVILINIYGIISYSM